MSCALRIHLCSIAGASAEDLDKAPDLQHPEFAKVNNTLQAMFAKAAMVAACVQGKFAETLVACTRDPSANELRIVLASSPNRRNTGEEEKGDGNGDGAGGT